MLERYYPALMVDRIQEIDAELLVKKGIRGLILDIDNTLVPNHVKDADEHAIQWIQRMKNKGFKACIVSNASKKRVIRFNEKLQLYAIHRASKPGTKSFLKAARLMDLKPKEIAVVGDQVFTDIYGGNKAGMFSILVKPLHHREALFIKAKRILERFVLARFHRRKSAGIR